MITVKRYNPDAAMSISREHAWMRETPEGGHVEYGDYASLFAQLELVKAERDALAVENAALKLSRETLAKNALETCNDVFSAGYHSPALHRGLMESTGNRNTYPNPISALVNEAVRELETPATDAALAAIRLEAKIEGVNELAERIAEMHSEAAPGTNIEKKLMFAAEAAIAYANGLREAK
ncbi:TPA: hypothetical protein ACQVG6_003488 [Serratia marcescens]